LDTRTAVDPAGAGVLDDAVDGAAWDGSLAAGVGEGLGLTVDVPKAELRAAAGPWTAGDG
jgi:hypothetical protein